MPTGHYQRHPKPLAVLFAKHYIPEPNSGCWLWDGAWSAKGYGTLTFRKKVTRAHRISWELHRGPIPEGMVVCHKCDIRCCVNPDHLWLGTQLENIQDCLAKGRHDLQSEAGLSRIRGANNYRAKFTEEQAREIRASTISGSVLARKFGVWPSTINRMRAGRSYLPRRGPDVGRRECAPTGEEGRGAGAHSVDRPIERG